ncbi:MAG: hypothetical protein ACI4TM_01505 [Candidatus Cryptobacteroides sp.]
MKPNMTIYDSMKPSLKYIIACILAFPLLYGCRIEQSNDYVRIIATNTSSITDYSALMECEVEWPKMKDEGKKEDWERLKASFIICENPEFQGESVKEYVASASSLVYYGRANELKPDTEYWWKFYLTDGIETLVSEVQQFRTEELTLEAWVSGEVGDIGMEGEEYYATFYGYAEFNTSQFTISEFIFTVGYDLESNEGVETIRVETDGSPARCFVIGLPPVVEWKVEVFGTLPDDTTIYSFSSPVYIFETGGE